MCWRQERGGRLWCKSHMHIMNQTEPIDRSFLTLSSATFKCWISMHLSIFPAERQRWSIGLSGARAQSHRWREHPKDKMRLVPARAVCERCLLLWVDIQSVQTLPQCGDELMACCEMQLCGKLDHSLQQDGAVLGPANSKLSPAWTMREEWGKSPYGKWPFWGFVLESVVFQRGPNWVIEDWMHQLQSIHPPCKWRPLASYPYRQFHNQHFRHVDGFFFFFDMFRTSEANKDYHNDSVLSPGIYLNIDWGISLLLLLLHVLSLTAKQSTKWMRRMLNLNWLLKEAEWKGHYKQHNIVQISLQKYNGNLLKWSSLSGVIISMWLQWPIFKSSSSR